MFVQGGDGVRAGARCVVAGLSQFYDGNRKYQSMGNLRQNPHLRMLFLDFEHGRRLRLQGMASIDEEDELLAAYPGHSSSSGCRSRKCTIIVPAIFTSTNSWSGLRTCHDATGSRRSPNRSGAPRCVTCYPRTINAPLVSEAKSMPPS